MKFGTLLSAFALVAMSMGLATSAKAADPIKIGVYMPLTGQNAFAGQLELEGIQLAHKITPTVLGPSSWSSWTTSPTRSNPPTP